MSDTVSAYEPPSIIWLGSVAELTQQKEIGAMDGEQFLGIDIGAIS
ncbi:MAG: lasso RiPP family leader peptide-containing protein [Pseudonocardiaceae bacterium]